MFKISVLMPVYNSECYLDMSIHSVISQSYNNWELICVDDGSTDRSLEILNNYSKADSRIKVFSQNNAGPMAARRLGFEHSNGEYIIYLDSDDRYSPDLLLSVITKAEETYADSVAPNMISIKGNENHSWNEEHKINTDEVLTGIEGFSETFPWNRIHGFNLWKREVFVKSVYHSYLNGNSFNADEILQRILLLNCNEIVYSKSGIYYYIRNNNSITHTFGRKNFNRITANEKLVQLALDYNLSSRIVDKIYGFAFFRQLKPLMFYFFLKPLVPEDKRWALSIMEKAFNEYRKHNLGIFYGDSVMCKLKSNIQTLNFSIFKFICFLQVKMNLIMT